MRSLVAAAILALGACRGGSDFVENDAGVIDDAGDAGADVVTESPNTTILTASPLPAATPSDATFVATRQEGDLEWRVLAAKSAGTYVFEAKKRWTAVVVCADDVASHVALFERTDATKVLEVTLDDLCLPPPAQPPRKLSGTLSNLPATSSWFDFAYARSVRGAATPTGATIAYELENLQDGTWDVAFGIRDDAAGVLTRVAIRRDEIVNNDKALDLDLATAVPAGEKALEVASIVPGDATTFTVAYTMNADIGLDLGPQIIPDQETVTTSYLTIPAALVKPADRYRGRLIAQSDGNRVSREAHFAIHDPIDVKVSLPSPLPEAPMITAVATDAHLGVQAKLKRPANVDRYELVATRKMNAKEARTWSVSLPGEIAAGDPIDYSLPNLGKVPGFRTDWDLPRGTLEVTVSAWERASTLGDGTLERVSRHTADFVY